MKTFLISALMVGVSIAVPAQAGDVAAGKTLFATCAGCHGAQAEGNKALNAPKLSGQEAWYMERQLNNFKAGIRGGANDPLGAQMAPMAKMLADDAAVANVVAYIGTLADAKAAATIEGDAAAGKGLYATCAACHGAQGEGNPAMNAPRLAGMSDFYLVNQLKTFRSGARGANADDAYGKTMAPMARMLDDAGIANVVAYINTL